MRNYLKLKYIKKLVSAKHTHTHTHTCHPRIPYISDNGNGNRGEKKTMENSLWHATQNRYDMRGAR